MNYENFARPEAEFAFPAGPAIELEYGYPCEECGNPCDERFCSAECEADAHACGEPDEDGCPEEMEFDPGEYDPRDGEDIPDDWSGYQDDQPEWM